MRRAGGAWRPGAPPTPAELPQLAAAAVCSPGVRRHILLAPGKRAPAKHQRAVPPAARQAAIDAAVPAHARGPVAVGGELIDGQLLPPAAGGVPVVVGWGAGERAAAAAAAARRLAEKLLQKPCKVDTARTGRYYSQSDGGTAGTEAGAGAGEAPASGGAVVAEPKEAAGVDAKPDLSAVVATALAADGAAAEAEGGPFSAAADALRQAISAGGAAALPCWRLLLLVSARRARLTGSQGQPIGSLDLYLRFIFTNSHIKSDSALFR